MSLGCGRRIPEEAIITQDFLNKYRTTWETTTAEKKNHTVRRTSSEQKDKTERKEKQGDYYLLMCKKQDWRQRSTVKRWRMCRSTWKPGRRAQLVLQELSEKTAKDKETILGIGIHGCSGPIFVFFSFGNGEIQGLREKDNCWSTLKLDC